MTLKYSVWTYLIIQKFRSAVTHCRHIIVKKTLFNVNLLKEDFRIVVI